MYFHFFITLSLHFLVGPLLHLNISAVNVNGEKKSLKDGFEELNVLDVSKVTIGHSQKPSITRKMMCSTPKTKGLFIFNVSFNI